MLYILSIDHEEGNCVLYLDLISMLEAWVAGRSRKSDAKLPLDVKMEIYW